MAYEDRHYLEKREQAWDAGMSHVAEDVVEAFAKDDSTAAIIDGDAKIAGLVSAAEGAAGGFSRRGALVVARAEEDGAAEGATPDVPGEGSAPVPAAGAPRGAAPVGSAGGQEGLFADGGRAGAGLAADDLGEPLDARAFEAERMGSLERALRSYGALQINDAELVAEAERDEGTQAYAEAKQSAFAAGRVADRSARRIADRPSSRRQSAAVKRADAKLARYADKAERRKSSKAWGQTSWYDRYSKTRVKRLEKRAKQARVVLKPSKWRWLIRIVSSVGVFALILLLCVGAIAILGAIGADQSAGGESLSASERRVFLYLKEKGLDEVHAAAILGNMRAEAGGECGDEFDTGSIEDGGSGGGHGLCQWTGGRWNGPGGLLEFATSQGKEWTDIGAQLDFFWTEYSGSWSGAYTIISGDSPPVGTYAQGSKSGFEAASEVAEATKQFCYGWERPGVPHESKRIRFAHWYLGALTGGGEHGDILSAAYEIAGNATPYVFGGTDIMNGCDCSYFTQWCYAQVGIDIPRQSEDQMRAGRTIPVAEAQPGDILWRFGHVGIYVDENTAVEQTPPYCRITPITYENWTCAVRFE